MIYLTFSLMKSILTTSTLHHAAQTKAREKVFGSTISKETKGTAVCFDDLWLMVIFINRKQRVRTVGCNRLFSFVFLSFFFSQGDLPVNENKYIQKVRQPSENETLDRFRQWFVARKAKNEKKPTAHQIMADFAVLVVRHKSTLNSCQLSNFGFLVCMVWF